MIKYAFLLEEKYKKPLADKPKRNAKVFQKSMIKITRTILDSQKTLKLGNLLNVMLNKDLKLCSARFEKGDFIYNIIVKEFPGPSNRFFMKILKEMHQARKQSGMTRKNFGSKQRAFEIELKKVIRKFNESEIQYKYFMRKIHIEEQKKTQLLEERKREEEQRREREGVKEGLEKPEMPLPRKTRIVSEIDLETLQKGQEMVEPRKTAVLSNMEPLEEKMSKTEEVVTIQTGNQTTEDEKEVEMPTMTENSPDSLNAQNSNVKLIVTEIDQMERQTLGVDSGSHYIVRKTKMLEQATLSKLAKMQILPEVNTESESETRSELSDVMESKIELKGVNGGQIQSLKVPDLTDKEDFNSENRHNIPRHTKQFIKE